MALLNGQISTSIQNSTAKTDSFSNINLRSPRLANTRKFISPSELSNFNVLHVGLTLTKPG